MVNEKTCRTDSSSFINVLNNYFADVGTTMASVIPTSNVSFKRFLSNQVSSSFVFEKIKEIYNVIKNLKTNKAFGIFEISYKFIKMTALTLERMHEKSCFDV